MCGSPRARVSPRSSQVRLRARRPPASRRRGIGGNSYREKSTTVASPPQGRMRPSRYLFTLAAIFIVLFGVVIGFGTGSVKDRLKPKLGLDLIGGTRLTLVAQTTNGQPHSADSLEQARHIIQRRVDAFGVSEAEVVTEGQNHIVISVPGENNDTIRQVGVPAQLR